MAIDLEDTIAALASAPGSGHRGLIRISGQGTRDVLDAVFFASEDSCSWRETRIPRRFAGSLLLEEFAIPVPVYLMWWPTRRSFTGQPMAELHLIGSPPILEAVLEMLSRRGARLARRGEFTMRAFLSGRIDLLQAEAVLGVIEEADHEELQKALRQLGGGMTTRLGQIRQGLIAILGDLEAGLDFVEEDIEFITRTEIIRRVTEGLDFLQRLASESAERLPAGYRRRIVLAGLPNAGKSTLFNRLTGSHRALVSPAAGTTRDYVTAVLQIHGMDVDLIDTAGWEITSDVIMSKAQELRREQLCASDLVIWCTSSGLSEDDAASNTRLLESASQSSAALLEIVTRADLGPHDGDRIAISAKSGWNMDRLEAELSRRLTTVGSARSELLGTTTIRCRDSLLRAIDALRNAREAALSEAGDEIISFEIRQALHELGTISGEVYTDDILDHIFSNFCIGK
ncbi:MAG: tRNA modification GTPase [Planctomycetota bacterium]